MLDKPGPAATFEINDFLLAKLLLKTLMGDLLIPDGCLHFTFFHFMIDLSFKLIDF